MDIIEWLVGESSSIDVYFIARFLFIVISVNFFGAIASFLKR